MPAQILFAKKRADETRAHSIVVGDAGFYWRELPNDGELTAALRKEHFSLIIVDHGDVAEDPLAFVESLRVGQKSTPVLVVSEQLALENVVRAIRVGVKDLFHPPIDLAAIVERIHSVLKPELGDTRTTRLDEWKELTVQFADRATIPPIVGVERRSGTPRRAADAAQAAELKAAQAALAEAEVRQKELEQELKQLAKAPAKAEPRSDDGLEAERVKLEAERKVVAQLGKKFEADFAAWKAAEGASRADLARREKVLEDKARELATAQETLEVEMLLVKEAKSKAAQEHAAAADIQAAQKDVAAKLKQVVIEQSALTKSREKLEKEEAAWAAAKAKAEAELAQREQRLAKLEAGVKGLAAEQEKFEATRAVAEGEQAKLAEERAELDRQAEALRASAEQLKAEREQLKRKEKERERLQAEVAAAVEKLEADRVTVNRIAGKVADEQDELEAARAELKQQARELAEKESALQEAQEQTDALAAQTKQAQAQCRTEKAKLAAERTAFEQEVKGLAERAKAFEAKQKLLKEQMQQMLAAG